jgi:hypothetical protein
VGAKLFHADRQTDGRAGITKLIVAFAIVQRRLQLCVGLTNISTLMLFRGVTGVYSEVFKKRITTLLAKCRINKAVLDTFDTLI